jgi:chemotaxis protein CheX
VLSTIASVQATPRKPFVKDSNTSKAYGDVSGIIGFTSDKAKGSMVITFSESAILDIANKMLGQKKEKLNNEIADLVGEITNMVTGGGKKKLSEQGYKFELAIPSTVMENITT